MWWRTGLILEEFVIDWIYSDINLEALEYLLYSSSTLTDMYTRLYKSLQVSATFYNKL